MAGAIIELSADLTDAEARKSFLENLYYIDPRIVAARFSDAGLEVDVRDGDLSEDLCGRIDELARETAVSFEKVQSQILFTQDGRGEADARDPFDHLLATRQVVPLGPGTYAYQGGFLATVRALDRAFCRMGLDMGAVEQEYPTTVSLPSMMKNGYLAAFPQHAYLVSSIHEDLGAVRRLANAAAGVDESAIAAAVREGGALRGVLGPAVCYNCFDAMRDQRIDEAGALVTAVNKCHRYESRNTVGLARLQVFTMREIVAFGRDTDVESARQDGVARVKAYVAALGLECRIATACDPFFAVEADKKRAFQSAFQLKYELQARLPHDDSWLSIASFNLHMDKLTTAYGVQPGFDGKLFSGCTAFGVERFAYALYCQFGPDPARWPFDLAEVS